MNNFYCNIGKNLSKQIQQPNEKPKEIASNLKSIFINPTNALEVMNIIKQLKNKSRGIDKINAFYLKNIRYLYFSPINTYIKSFDRKIGVAGGHQKCGGNSNI